MFDKTENAVHTIRDLRQLDVDAVHAYETALKKISAPGIHENIASFKGDHERHIATLCRALDDLGDHSPAPKPDLKGLFLQGLTALRSASGTEGALRAMRSNEELTTRTYNEALSAVLPAAVLTVVRHNAADEERHLHYINQTLAQLSQTAARGTRPRIVVPEAHGSTGLNTRMPDV